MITDTSTNPGDSAGPSQLSRNPPDILANYERLLQLYTDQLRQDEFNPYQSLPLIVLKSLSPAYQFRFWKNAAPFFSVPNTLRQDLRGGALILQELEGFDDQTLRGVTECSRINYRRVLGRSVLGWLPKLAAFIALVFALTKAIKEGVGTDLFAAVPTGIVSFLTMALVGLLLGSILNLILSLPGLGIVRALDDLIGIAVAQRGARKPE
jgi:hypothetical protein